MKIIAIILITGSVIWFVRIYIKGLENQLCYFRDWEKIFRAWSEWISRFSVSVDELIEQTVLNSLTCDLSVSKTFKDKTFSSIVADVGTRRDINPSENEVILEVLQNIGNSMVEKEINNLTYATEKLQEVIQKRENLLKERRNLLYKLAPLLCGGLAVVLW